MGAGELHSSACRFLFSHGFNTFHKHGGQKGGVILLGLIRQNKAKRPRVIGSTVVRRRRDLADRCTVFNQMCRYGHVLRTAIV
jgi:hypothetical protein